MMVKNWGKYLVAGFVSLLTFEVMAIWDEADVVFHSQSQNPGNRCPEGSKVDSSKRTKANKWALTSGAITERAYKWLEENNWYVTLTLPDEPGSICKPGCFHPATEILMSDEGGVYQFKKASDLANFDNLLQYDSTSSLDRPNFKSAQIKDVIRGLEEKDLFVFHLDNGRRLKVTEEHGVVFFDGKMATAKEVKVGSSFVSMTGEPVAILEITKEKTNEKVVNFSFEGSEYADHLGVAERVLIGESAFQNQYASNLAQINLRKN